MQSNTSCFNSSYRRLARHRPELAGIVQKMDLIEYLKMRRAVEQAPPSLVKEAYELAEIGKTRNMELITEDQMWNAMLELAEEKYPGPPKLNVLK